MDNVRSITRAVQILETFRHGSVLTTAELARALQIPKSSIYEILRTLTDEGLLERVDGHYRLGLRLIELAHTAVQDLEVGRVGRPVLQRLRDELNETVQLTVLYGEEVLYVEGYESTHQLRTFFELGDRAPLYCTALGKAILAFRGETEIQKVVGQKGLRAFTARTLTEGPALRKDLERTVARGYAIDDMEHEEGVRCVAAPIRSRHGEVFASISVSGPAHRVTRAREAEIAARAVEVADEISRRMGYQPAGKKPARARRVAVQGGGRK